MTVIPKTNELLKFYSTLLGYDGTIKSFGKTWCVKSIIGRAVYLKEVD